MWLNPVLGKDSTLNSTLCIPALGRCLLVALGSCIPVQVFQDSATSFQDSRHSTYDYSVTFAVSRQRAHVREESGSADCGPAVLVTILRLFAVLPVGNNESQMSAVRATMHVPEGRPTSSDQLQDLLDAFHLENALISSMSLEEMAFAVDCGLPIILTVHGSGINVGRGHAFVVSGHYAAAREYWIVSDPSSSGPREVPTEQWFPDVADRYAAIAVGQRGWCASRLCAHGGVGSLCASD